MKQLTDKQRRLVEDNLMLAYSFVHKYGNKYLTIEPEDKYSLALLGLCNAARTWDKSRGIKFSSYAYIAIDNQMKMELRAQTKSKPEGTVILSSQEDVLDADNVMLEDLIEDFDDKVEQQEVIIRLKEEYNKLNDRDKFIIHCIANGLTHREIIQLLQHEYHIKLAQPTISRIRTKFIKAVKE